MLHLSIEEQKQIIGGRWKAIIYDPSGKKYKTAYFSSEDAAVNWAEDFTRNGGSYSVVEV